MGSEFEFVHNSVFFLLKSGGELGHVLEPFFDLFDGKKGERYSRDFSTPVFEFQKKEPIPGLILSGPMLEKTHDHKSFPFPLERKGPIGFGVFPSSV